MHSYHGKEHNFHFNGDFSGEIHIVNKETNIETTIDSEELINFILSEGLELIEEKLKTTTKQ